MIQFKQDGLLVAFQQVREGERTLYGEVQLNKFEYVSGESLYGDVQLNKFERWGVGRGHVGKGYQRVHVWWGEGWGAGPCDLCLTNDIKGSEQTDSPENIIFPQLR